MAKVKGDEKNIHEGHRARLLRSVVASRLQNLSEIQQMEFILTYIFPRGDTNPLAHRLLDRYGSIGAVLDADPVDLQSIRGIGQRAAEMLTLLPEIFDLYTRSRISKREDLSSYSDIFDFCETLVGMSTTEQLYIVGMDAKSRLSGYRLLAQGSINMVGINQNEITKFLNSCNPVHVFMLHNHPGGSAVPSDKDVKATGNLAMMFKTLGVDFIDHYIVGGDGIFSILKSQFEREYLPV